MSNATTNEAAEQDVIIEWDWDKKGDHGILVVTRVDASGEETGRSSVRYDGNTIDASSSSDEVISAVEEFTGMEAHSVSHEGDTIYATMR